MSKVLFEHVSVRDASINYHLHRIDDCEVLEYLGYTIDEMNEMTSEEYNNVISTRKFEEAHYELACVYAEQEYYDMYAAL